MTGKEKLKDSLSNTSGEWHLGIYDGNTLI